MLPNMDDEDTMPCWLCAREIAPEEPPRLVQVPATDAMYPAVFREAIACLHCVGLGDLDRVCPDPEGVPVMRNDEIRLLVLRLPL
jgi:hypothetical protein